MTKNTKVIIYDLERQYDDLIASKCDHALPADGKYAPCQGCFGCWTKQPDECFMKDKLQQVCRIIGQADNMHFAKEYNKCLGSKRRDILYTTNMVLWGRHKNQTNLILLR